MVKQLIITASLLLIQNASEAIYILKPFFILQFLFSMFHIQQNPTLYATCALYRLKKTKIVFKHHQLIDLMLCQTMFNYPKIYSVIYFVQYIWDYSSVVNYDTVHSKAAHKYLFQAFYNRIN